MENKSKLSWEKFESLFGSWSSKIKPFFFSGGFDEIFAKLKQDSARGKKIFPSSENVFRAFRECPIDEIRVILVGACPYHSMKDSIIIADGLCLSCGNTNYPQPSLDYFLSSIETELYNGLCVPCNRKFDLSYLSNNEGVLLLNAGLTVEHMKPMSHNLLWEPFMKYLFENVFDALGVPIVLMGNDAQKLEKYISPFSTILRVSHPASAAYKNEDYWDSKGLFQELDYILRHKHGKGINWFDESEEIPF